MPARCFNDSCSVEWSEVVTGDGPAYQADVLLDPARGITCVEDEGIGINLADPGCFASLAIASNQLGISLSSAVVATSDGTRRGIPNAGPADPSDPSDYGARSSLSHNFSIANPFECNALLLLNVEFLIDYRVQQTTPVVGAADAGGALGGAGDGDRYPFNANIKAEVTTSAPYPDLITYFDIGGVVAINAPNDHQDKNARRSITRAIVLEAGNPISIETYAVQAGRLQNINWFAADPGNNYGFFTRINSAILPIGA